MEVRNCSPIKFTPGSCSRFHPKFCPGMMAQSLLAPKSRKRGLEKASVEEPGRKKLIPSGEFMTCPNAFFFSLSILFCPILSFLCTQWRLFLTQWLCWFKQHSSISPLCAASARTSHHHEFGSEAVPTKRKGPETRRLSTLIVNRPASTKTLQNKISSNFISGSRISVSNLGISWHPKCTQECRSREFCEKLSTQPPQVPGMVPTALHEPDTFGIFVARETLKACGDFDGLS